MGKATKTQWGTKRKEMIKCEEKGQYKKKINEITLSVFTFDLTFQRS